jgi:hypothetical protein
MIKIRENFRRPSHLPSVYTKIYEQKKLSLTLPIFHFLSLITQNGVVLE